MLNRFVAFIELLGYFADFHAVVYMESVDFTTVFRKQTGMAPQEYLLQCRFKNGCRLLTETDYPVQKIAELIGYDDPLAFSKAFKKYYKTSPTAYREQNWAGNGATV